MKQYNQNELKTVDIKQPYNIFPQLYQNTLSQTTTPSNCQQQDQGIFYNDNSFSNSVISTQNNNFTQNYSFKSQKHEFKQDSIDQEQRQMKFFTQKYEFTKPNIKDIELVLFDQIKDENLDQSPIKIICNQEQIKKLLNIKDDLIESQQLNFKQQLRVIGFYGNYCYSIKLINQLFPSLKINNYQVDENNFYPQYDQIVAFSLRDNNQENQNEENEKIIKRTIILVYKENKNSFQDFMHLNEDSKQLIRYMIDVCHVFVNVLPKSNLYKWGNPQFKKSFKQNINDEWEENQFQFQEQIEFKFQNLTSKSNGQRGDDALHYSNLIQQISEYPIHQNQYILTQQLEDKTGLIAISNHQGIVFNQSKIENIQTKIKNSSFDYFKSVHSIQYSKISQTEKICKIKEKFSTFMQLVKEEFTFSSSILIDIEQIEEKEIKEITQIQGDLKKSENTLTTEYAQELFVELKNNFEFNNCCQKKKKTCSQNNCISIFQIIQLGISQIKSNEIITIKDYENFDSQIKKNKNIKNQEWIDQFQKFLIEQQNQIILNSLIKELQQIINSQKQDLMIEEQQRDNLLNTLFYKMISICETISKKLTLQNEKIFQKCQISNNLLENIQYQLDKLSSIKLNEIHLNLHEMNLSNDCSDGLKISPTQIILPPSIKKVEKYFYYNEYFDYIVGITYESENLKDQSQFYKLQNNPTTQIWRYNKTQKNNQLTRLQNLQPGRVVEISSITKNWLIYDLEKKQFEIGSIDQHGMFQNGKQFDLKTIIQKQSEKNYDEDLEIKSEKRIFIQEDIIYIFDYEQNCIFRIGLNNQITKLIYSSNNINYDDSDDEDDKQEQIEDVVLVQQKDQFLFALLFKENIKFTNENLIDKKIDIKIPFPEMDVKDIKIFTYENFIKIILYREDNQLQVLYQPSPINQYSQYQYVDLQNQYDDKGNLMIDKIAFSIEEFGPRVTDSFVVKQSKLFFYAEEKEFQQNIKQYIENDQFKNIFQNFFTDISKQFEDQTSLDQQILNSLQKIEKDDKFSEEQLEFCLNTRAPIQISTFKDFEYQSLKNGILDSSSRKLNQSSKTTIYESKQKLEFGWYDKLINEIPQNKTFILSIYGQQSVGKSSQLNRLFNSRFGVSAAKCTDGIWMSLIRLQEDIYIILLDCEGIYSTKRTEEEENILMQQIAMVSDISIMFNDLSAINKGCKKILENLKRVSEKDKESEYYQGDLVILTKGIDDERKLQQIKQQLQAELNATKYLKRTSLLYLHSFLHQDFQKNLMEVKNEIIKKLKVKLNDRNQNNCKFDSDQERSKKESHTPETTEGNNTDEQFQFQHSFKQTYIKKQNIKLDLIKYSFCQLQLNDKQNIRQILYAEQIDHLKIYFENQMHNFEFDGKSYTFSEQLYDSENKYQLSIEQKLFKFNKYKDSEIQEDGFHSNIKQFINFICQQQNIQVYTLQVNILQNIRPIVQQISRRTVEERMRILNQFIQIQTDHRPENNSLNKQLINHNQQVYEDIMVTITICDQNSNCGNKCIRCKNHQKEHFCGRMHIDDIKCQDQCSEFQFCQRSCTKEIGHQDLHYCDQSCHNKCILCQKRCQFQRGHSETFHICDQDHQCKSSCEQDGFCEFDYDTIDKVYKPKHEQEFIYKQHNQNGIKKACGKMIPKGKDKHEGNHDCELTQHFCKQACPECGCLCQKQIDHEGKHFSEKHRYLESKMGIYLNKCEQIIINDIAQNDCSLNNQNSSLYTSRVYNDGDEVKPEFCEEQCKRLQRGHTHFSVCRGVDQCLERQLGQEKAKHSKEIRNNIQFDEIRCHDFWKYYNWTAPLKQKDKQSYIISNKCNWGCSHETHLSKQNYCKSSLWHQGPHDIDFNVDGCKHNPPYNIIDLCFTMDTTSSMQWAVDQVKEVVSHLISSFDVQHRDYDLKIAFVGYRDHEPQAKAYTAQVYSNLVNPNEIYPIIDKIKVNEGGDIPEAVIDGLLETALKINWRNKSTRYVFHIFDAPPHGLKQYGFESTSWNSGCPCKKTIQDVSKEFKKRDLKYFMIQCSSVLEQTRQVFEKELKNLFQACVTINKKSKQDHSQLHTKLKNVIAKQIMSTDYFFYNTQNNKQ